MTSQLSCVRYNDEHQHFKLLLTYMALSLPVNHHLILSCCVDGFPYVRCICCTYTCKHVLNSGSFNVNIVMSGWLKSNDSEVIRIIKVDYMFTNSL